MNSSVELNLETMNNPLVRSAKDLNYSDTKRTQPAISTNNKLNKIQTNLDSVKDTMIDNMGKLSERGEKLEDLEKKTEDLYYDANIFERSARRMKRKLCMQNIKKNIIILRLIFS